MGKGSKNKPYFAWEMAEEFAVNSEPYQLEPTFLQLTNSDVTIFISDNVSDRSTITRARKR